MIALGGTMQPADAVKSCLSKYVQFSGRALRSEYWWFFVFQSVCAIVATILDSTFFSVDPMAEGFQVSPLSSLITLALFLPGLAVTVRRLHDVGRSGWWVLIIVTVIGIFLLLYWMIKPGDVAPNEYGEPQLATA